MPKHGPENGSPLPESDWEFIDNEGPMLFYDGYFKVKALTQFVEKYVVDREALKDFLSDDAEYDFLSSDEGIIIVVDWIERFGGLLNTLKHVAIKYESGHPISVEEWGSIVAAQEIALHTLQSRIKAELSDA